MDFFGEQGYNSFSISLRGHTGSYTPDNFSHTCLSDYTNDALKVSQFIQENYGADFNNQIIIGHSMGGIIALDRAKKCDAKALILLSSGVPIELTPDLLSILGIDENKARAIEDELTDKINKQELMFRTPENLAGLFAGNLPTDYTNNSEKYLNMLSPDSFEARRQAYFYPPSVKSGEIQCPVLVVGATKDASLPPEAMKKLAQYFNGDYMEVQGGSHMFMFEDSWPQTADTINAWLEKTANKN